MGWDAKTSWAGSELVHSLRSSSVIDAVRVSERSATISCEDGMIDFESIAASYETMPMTHIY
jgi:hypothetical protein